MTTPCANHRRGWPATASRTRPHNRARGVTARARPTSTTGARTQRSLVARAAAVPAAQTQGPAGDRCWSVRKRASADTRTATAGGQNWRANVHHWVDQRVRGVTAKKVSTGMRSQRPGRIRESTCHRRTSAAATNVTMRAAASDQPSGAASATAWAMTTEPGENPAVLTTSVGEAVGRVMRKSFWLNQPPPTITARHTMLAATTTAATIPWVDRQVPAEGSAGATGTGSGVMRTPRQRGRPGRCRRGWRERRRWRAVRPEAAPSRPPLRGRRAPTLARARWPVPPRR